MTIIIILIIIVVWLIWPAKQSNNSDAVAQPEQFETKQTKQTQQNSIVDNSPAVIKKKKDIRFLTSHDAVSLISTVYAAELSFPPYSQPLKTNDLNRNCRSRDCRKLPHGRPHPHHQTDLHQRI